MTNRLIGVATSAWTRLAAGALDGDARLGFVTAWGDWPLANGAGLRPCTPAMLLGRPAAALPTLFRAGDLDATLPSGGATDLALRLCADGYSGSILDLPFGEAERGDRRPLLRKHRATVEAHAEEILIIKERWLRALQARSRARHQEELRLQRELQSLDEEARLLQRCIDRLR